MPEFKVHIELNKKQTMFFATIRNDKDEVVKEFVEDVSPLGPKLHDALVRRKCIDWVKYEQEDSKV
jgi:hypothetical protein